jgi:trk system potassium uptake protein TrkH
MVLAGVNFTLHFSALTGRLGNLKRNTEFKAYLGIFLVSTTLMAVNLLGVYDSWGDCLRHASFQAASILTTTGFTTCHYEHWPHLSQMVLFMLMFIGGSSGSTAGGIKVIRIVTLLKQGLNEMKFLLHPRGIFTLKISGGVVKKNVAYAISGFFFLYMLLLLFIAFIVGTSGQDPLTSFSTALATLGNIGPGFGGVGPAHNYAFFPDYVKWILSFAMLVGRLELYTVLVLFTPRFWNR